jgi:uncharacterized damage-inducible protein DinB
MNAEAFRYYYNYHFSMNRMIWDSFVSQLSFEQFTRNAAYSNGSVRDQIIHLIDVEDVWFSELRGSVPSEPIPPATLDDRKMIRSHWDRVEQNMRDYLTGLRNEQLYDKPIQEPEEDRGLIVWQVLLHVVNHGTDHRAQLLRLLNDLGLETTSQDYIFYVYENR